MAGSKRLSTTDRRRFRVRKKLVAAERPRLSVHRTPRYIYAQIIDDRKQRTVVPSSSFTSTWRP